MAENFKRIATIWCNCTWFGATTVRLVLNSIDTYSTKTPVTIKRRPVHVTWPKFKMADNGRIKQPRRLTFEATINEWRYQSCSKNLYSSFRDRPSQINRRGYRATSTSGRKQRWRPLPEVVLTRQRNAAQIHKSHTDLPLSGPCIVWD
jgi:hypothetical protein